MVDRSIAPKATRIGDLKMPPLNVESLSNGSTLSVCDGGIQDINLLTLIFAGGTNEAKSKSVPKLMCNCLLEGSESMDGAEIYEAFDFRGAKVSVYASTHHTIFAIASLNSMSDGVFPLIREVLLRPSFPEKALEIMRDKAVKELLMNMTKVATLSQIAINPLIMGLDNPDAQVETPEEIEAITRADLLDFHSRVVKAEGCQAFLSGKITDKILHEAKSLLADLPAGHAAPLNIVPYSPMPPETMKVEKKDALQCSVRFALPAPMRSDLDYIPLRMAVIALGGYFGSRLMRNIREDKGYTYGISSYALGNYDGSFILTSAQADPAYVEPLIHEVKAEMEKLATQPMDDDELDRLKQHIASDLVQSLDGPIAINAYYQTKVVVGLPDGYFDRQVEIARTLTAQTIMEMGAKYLRPDQLRIVIAG